MATPRRRGTRAGRCAAPRETPRSPRSAGGRPCPARTHPSSAPPSVDLLAAGPGRLAVEGSARWAGVIAGARLGDARRAVALCPWRTRNGHAVHRAATLPSRPDRETDRELARPRSDPATVARFHGEDGGRPTASLEAERV